MRAMDELKAIFAGNLIRLRTGAGMTQAELGERIHYSDKSISKWERAEAIPDAYVLTQIAAVFGVTVNDLLSDHSAWKPEEDEVLKPVTYSRLFIVLCAVAGIWTFALVNFVVLWMLGSVHWSILLTAIPLSIVTFLVFNSIWNSGRKNMYIIMSLVLCVLLLLFLEIRDWRLFLLLLPGEIVVYLACHIRKHPEKPAPPKERADG